MQYRAAICDDHSVDAAYLQTLVSSWATARQVQLRIEIFSSAESFLFQFAADPGYDLLFLDIEMGKMDGVTLAKQIRQTHDTVQIIFTTGFPDYIAEGYEVSALHYLMKPLEEEKLHRVLDRAFNQRTRQEQTVLLPIEGELVRLKVAQVEYVEAFAHSVMIAAEGQQLAVRLSISEVEKLLGDAVVRCHRSYLAGLRHMVRLSRTEAVLDSGKTIPLSRSAAPMVHRAFVAYYQGEIDETV